MKRILLSLILLSSLQGNALPPQGYERGNGGFLMECSAKSFTGPGFYSVDHIEGIYLHDLVPTISITMLKDEIEIVRYILKRLKTVNPTRAALYSNWLDELLSSREFVKNFKFLPLPDSGATMIPEGCQQEQAAIFVTTPGSSRIRFLFNPVLWAKTPILDRAYLLMHELIYREATLPENSHINSVATRYLNAWLFHHADYMEQTDLIHVLRSLRFSRADYQGLALRLTIRTPTNSVRQAPIEYHTGSKQIRIAQLADSFNIKIGQDIFQRICNDSFIGFFFENFVEFYPSGKIKKVVFASSDKGNIADYTSGYKEVRCDYNGFNKLEFDEAGRLQTSSSAPRYYGDAYISEMN